MTRRYPLEPLAKAMRCSVHEIAETLGISGTYLRKVRDNGLSARTADHAAVAAGFHPYEIWPEMHAHALADTADWPDIDETPRQAKHRRHLERKAASTETQGAPDAIGAVHTRGCAASDCPEKHWCRGCCYRHYKQLWRRARRGAA